MFSNYVVQRQLKKKKLILDNARQPILPQLPVYLTLAYATLRITIAPFIVNSGYSRLARTPQGGPRFFYDWHVDVVPVSGVQIIPVYLKVNHCKGRYPGGPVCLRHNISFIKKVGCRALSGVVGCRALSNIKQHTHLRDSHCCRYWTITGKKKIVGNQIVE